MRFVDAAPLLDAALADLALGQLVHGEVTLLELMSAIEVRPLLPRPAHTQIMDVRTDSYLQGRSAEPPFVPERELTATELRAIMDELFQLEMTFHDGHPLSSTVFTCQYLRNASLLAVSGLAPVSSKGKGKAPQNGLRTIVLRAYLLGLIKSIEIAWEELCKGQVYEHEDVQLSTANLKFSSLLASCFPPAASPLRIVHPDDKVVERAVSVDDVLAALDEATQWVEANVEDPELVHDLNSRLSLKTDIIYATALLSSPPHTTPAQLAAHLDQSLATLAVLLVKPPTPDGMTPELRAIFKRGQQTPLSSMTPIRIFDPLSLEDSWVALKTWLEDLKSAVGIWSAWGAGVGWAGLNEYFLALARGSMSPYPRSVHQTLLCHARTIFGTSPANSLAISFLSDTACIPPGLWATLVPIRDEETSFKSPARRVLGWLDKLSMLLVGVFNAACQNRPRAMRLVMKGISAYENLLQESIDVGPLLMDLLPSLSISPVGSAYTSTLGAPLMILLLSQIQESLYSGLDFDLYDHEEHARLYWVLHQVCDRLTRKLEVLGKRGSSYSFTSMHEMSGMESMFRAGWILTTLYDSDPQRKKSSMTTPLLNFDEPDRMDKARFERRFEWIKGASFDGEDPFESMVRWEDYSSETERIAASTDKPRIAWSETARTSLNDARTSFLASRDVKRFPSYDETDALHRSERHAKMLDQILARSM